MHIYVLKTEEANKVLLFLLFIGFVSVSLFRNSCGFILCEPNWHLCSFLLESPWCSRPKSCQYLSRSVLFLFGTCLLCHVEGNKTLKQDQRQRPGQGPTFVLLAVVSNCTAFLLWGPTCVNIILTSSSCPGFTRVPEFLTQVFSSRKSPATDQSSGDSPSRWRCKSCDAGSSFLWERCFNQTLKSRLLIWPQIWQRVSGSLLGISTGNMYEASSGIRCPYYY